MSDQTDAVDALQTALAAEHAAVYVLASLGGRLSRSDNATLFETVEQAYDDHVAARDTLIDHVVAAGARPIGSAAAYDLPRGAGSPVGIRRAALALEQHCAATYLSLVTAVNGDQRRLLITLLGDAAVRQLDFGGSVETFPGS